MTATGAPGEWHTTACILCECNCGLWIQLDGRRLARIRGDEAHPTSAGYACEKPLRLDHYQNGRDRLTSPLRREPDGSYTEIDWDTAVAEITERLTAIRDTHGGESIFFYGGGGQGNHLPIAYGQSLRAALGSRYYSNALAQEKTGEMWVDGRLSGGHSKGDFEHAEVVLFLGKNPWQSHSFPRARPVLREIARDPARTMIVIDPRRSETAELAEFHLQVRPGTDAWCLAAMLGVLVQEDLLDHEFVAVHTRGAEAVSAALAEVPVGDYAARCGVDEDLLRAATRRFATAETAASYEDLGVQQAPNSTLCSYLHKLLWILTGNFGRPGTMYLHSSLTAISGGSGSGKGARLTPVTGARIIGGLIPCNSIADEILTDHPGRLRAMWVDGANPAHSLADSARFGEAMRALELSVVIDVAFTETARQADYVLPAATQYEKWEATFFNFEFPRNVFQLRGPLLEPAPGTLPEPEIYARVLRALGPVDETVLTTLRAAAEEGAAAFESAFFAAAAADPTIMPLAGYVLYETLGPTLPNDARSAAVLWGTAQLCAAANAESVARAGFDGTGFEPGRKLFDAILNRRSGVEFTVDEWSDVWRYVRRPDRRFTVAIDELLTELRGLGDARSTWTTDEFPLVLSAGERRAFTANTIIRDPGWRRRDQEGALRISPQDAQQLGVGSGDRVRVVTETGAAETAVEVSELMQTGHISLPNGLGVDAPDANGRRQRTGVAPNDLTTTRYRDPIAGTPWHKYVPARVEALQ
ncbi:molybdopterin-dependent oxidoreductase [Skermania piniformis]|uniref:Molybdopterin-dependent oxidoreductase n=1 Tax=Skermania pinensis TaxID=39122 RepID=A0ABX8S9F4_9ACTN|nr:molybdopterin-dependent oxidoreductase [Skermania piniformis]QXQ14452.1 molybdopterin-dependent oxidoreductase [Skermania piniformis]